MPGAGRNRWWTLLGAIALMCLVAVVFFPIVGYEFVDYDVRVQVLENRYIRSLSLENLKHVLTSRCITSYYPVRTLSFAVDYYLWGLNPGGFKLTNGLIHLANVLLVYWLVTRLFHRPDAAGYSSSAWWDRFVATCSAGVFAIHPVVVEPVAWVAGREELLMTLGALGCLHFHISGRRLAVPSVGDRRSPTEWAGGRLRAAVACHAAAALCCAAACLSNAVGAVIPLLIVAWDLVTLSRPRLRRIIYATSALWVIAMATMAIKRLGADRDLVAGQVGAFSAERLALILNMYWLNLQTLVWPTQLAVNYPGPRPESFLDAEVVLGATAAGLTCGALWLCRRQRLVLFGLLWFCLALGPTSQIMPHHVPRADRFLYLPLVGLVVSMAIGVRPVKTALAGRVTGVVIAAVGVLSFLGLLSACQVRTWRNSASMWENCLKVDPHNALAHGGLADKLSEAGQFDQAIQHYRLALRLDPNNLETLKNFALLLAVCPREELRDHELALRLAERACELIDRPDPVAVAAVMVRAEVHAQAGRPDMAIAAVEEAIAMAQAAGEVELAEQLRGRLELYQSRSPAEPARQ